MKKALRIALWIFGGVIGLFVLTLAIAWLAMRASLPTLNGDAQVPALSVPTTVTRDAQGAVNIIAANTLDAARALGYVHAQERFFEMDLARRSAAGELSALLGAATLNMDKEKRRHRLRARAERHLAALPSEQRELLSAYAAGVNAGLNAFAVRPWQYLVTRATPAPWREVDSLLVGSEMYYMLQASGTQARFTDITLRHMLGDRLFDWMRPTGGEWDATVDGVAITPPPMPTPAELDVRNTSAPPTKTSLQTGAMQALNDAPAVGSNNWAIAASRSIDGGAILANDMHLGLGVPGIWFRAQLEIGVGEKKIRVSGVTLPGLPGTVVGSNGHIAWGFTNSYGQWFDWVAIPKPTKSNAQTPVTVPITTHTEIIRVKGSDDMQLTVREAPFGPILNEDAQNEYALSWTLYRPGALNLKASGLMFAKSIDEALPIAQQSGIPHQNFMVADRAGNIAWTIMGRIENRPAQHGPRGTLTSASALPNGWLAPDQYPVVRNPADGQLWTANSRQLGSANHALVGDGSFDLGARAMQIRDRLREKEKLSERDLYAIQLDTEARFLKRWRALAQSVAASSKKVEVEKILTDWNGRADVDQVGHRILRAFRIRVQEKLWLTWLSAADKNATVSGTPEEHYKKFNVDSRFEYAAWHAINSKAPHLLPPGSATWDVFLEDNLLMAAAETSKMGSLSNATWGKRNTAKIKHPFSRAMPFLTPYLDMPADEMPGDNHMPLVASPTFGASQRLIVSPGKEERGILTVAGGQSGHPLSPFYGAGHREWLAGAPQPLLPGAPTHTLLLKP